MIVKTLLIEQDGGMPILLTVDHKGEVAWSIFGDEADARYFATEVLPADNLEWCRVSKDLEVSRAPGTVHKRPAVLGAMSQGAARVKRFGELLESRAPDATRRKSE